MPANTAQLPVGRLLEIRADGGYRTAVDVDRLFTEIEQAAAPLVALGTPHIAVVDWRHCPLMSPEAAARIAQRIAAMNSRVQRSAALARQDAPVAVLQFVRVIREAGHPERRLFFNEDELITWLDEVLGPDERLRLRLFLINGRVRPKQ